MSQTIRWYIVLTRSSAEWQANKELLKKGIRSYYPYYYADVRRNRWHQGVIKPQFPGYLFIGLEPGESIEAARHVNGVLDFLRSGGGLVTLSDVQMERCRLDCDQRYWDTLPRRVERTPVKLGDWVAVPHGAFAGMPAEVLSIDRAGQISASLGNLNVTFHISDVQSGARQSRNAGKNPVLPPLSENHAAYKRSA